MQLNATTQPRTQQHAQPKKQEKGVCRMLSHYEQLVGNGSFLSIHWGYVNLMNTLCQIPENPAVNPEKMLFVL